MHRVQALRSTGQSLWYDFIRRELITSGKLAALIGDDYLAGMTSNPTIFEKAIGHSTDYDEDIRALAARGAGTAETLDALTSTDIRAACDAFRPLYDATRGLDGRVSIEVAPEFGRDATATVAEGLRLKALVARPNVMVKVPATKEGLVAIERLTAAGVDVNVTLIFSVDRYREVMGAYLKGLEARAAKAQPVDGIHSVASFFVSRIDVAANKRIDAKLASVSPADRPALQDLRWAVAVANSKRAYGAFKETFASDRFKGLAARGAAVQRVLWASTGAKDPSQPPLFYVNRLTGPDSVDTVPPECFEAFVKDGETGNAIDRDRDGAERTLQTLEGFGISLAAICEELEADGLASFAKSWATLRQELEAKRQALGVTS